MDLPNARPDKAALDHREHSADSDGYAESGSGVRSDSGVISDSGASSGSDASSGSSQNSASSTNNNPTTNNLRRDISVSAIVTGLVAVVVGFGGTAVLTGRLAGQNFRVRLLGSEVPAEPVFEARPTDFWILPGRA